jgi:REP element-mobilizing transposase RayT
MPRRPRLHVPGAFYHVILRGNGRQDVFFDEADRLLWQHLIADRLHHSGHRLHAYCWMTNHVHMAIQAHAEPLGHFIGTLASQYARRTNRRIRRSGHLFERRHRALLVQRDEHLLELVRYIHLNPVRAGMVEGPGDYRWSSHPAYADGTCSEWLTVDRVLALFGPTAGQARAAYAAFMKAPVDEGLWQLLRTGRDDDPRVLGDDDFVRSITTDGRGVTRSCQTLDELVHDACRRHGVCEADLAAPSRDRSLARVRAEIGRAAIEGRVATLAAVARRFGRSPSGLCRSVGRLRGR